LRAVSSEVLVKLYIRGNSEVRLHEILDKATEWVLERIGSNVISVNGDSIEKVVGDLLKIKNSTLAVAESCTGGLIADLITSQIGSSDYFLFSGVTYSNESKTLVLGVNPQTIKTYGAVSEETAGEMAEGARKLTGATYAIATSGVAGPDGGTEEKPVGTVCIGLATSHGTTTKRLTNSFGRINSGNGSRDRNKRWFATMALEILRRELLVK